MVDFTHFKRKRLLKIDRATFCTEWKSALNDLEVDQTQDSDLIKYADDSNILSIVRKNSLCKSEITLKRFMEWTCINNMNCKHLVQRVLIIHKQGNTFNDFPKLYDIPHVTSLSVFGATLQSDSKFALHVKGKLAEANKSLYVIRSLRKEGLSQKEVDHLFKSIVLYLR